MNAPTFDAHPSVCPICHHSRLLKSRKLFTGLIVCEHCRERLVVTWSGHYVRDPFRLRPASMERALRRESHPFYRILRDLNLTRSNVWMALLAGTLLLGVWSAVSEKLAAQQTKPVSPTSLNTQRSLF